MLVARLTELSAGWHFGGSVVLQVFANNLRSPLENWEGIGALVFTTETG